MHLQNSITDTDSENGLDDASQPTVHSENSTTDNPIMENSTTDNAIMDTDSESGLGNTSQPTPYSNNSTTTPNDNAAATASHCVVSVMMFMYVQM